MSASDRSGAPPALRRVAVVGGGLIGASFALASRALEGIEDVAVWDRDAATREAASGLGLRVASDLAGTVRDADLVLVAVPVPAIAEVVVQVDAVLTSPAILTDTGSVKSRVVLEVEGSPLRFVRFIAGHPMAGSERSGIDAADGKLFQGASWMLTPTPTSDPGAFEAVGAHLRRIGARVLAVSPELHDRVVAVASHLPQTIASTLMVQAADVADDLGDAVLSVAGGGFRDVTRIAASEPELWVGILLENRAAVLEALDDYAGRLHQVRELLAAADGAALRRWLADGRTARRRLPEKATVSDLVDLVVAVADAPGALATVTTALGEAGVNIEDLSMRHASSGDRGALVVAVDGREAADRALRLLAERGVHAHVEPRTAG